MADPIGNNSAGTLGSGSAAGGDLSGTYPNPTVANTGGVAFGPASTAILGQIPGIATSGVASAGNIGEYLSTNLASSAALTLTTNTGTGIVGLALSAGDWDVWGQAFFNIGLLTVVSTIVAAISTTAGSSAAGIPTLISGQVAQIGLGAGLTGGSNTQIPIGPVRISVAAAATAFLNVSLTFATSTASVYGVIQARRRR